MYELEENLARKDAIIWKLYVVLAEVMVRFGPCTLLIVLNLLMIRDFHTSLHRRMLLNTFFPAPSPPMNRNRKLTVSSYVQSYEDKDKSLDHLAPNIRRKNITSVSLTEKKSSPLVINVSWTRLLISYPVIDNFAYVLYNCIKCLNVSN